MKIKGFDSDLKCRHIQRNNRNRGKRMKNMENQLKFKIGDRVALVVYDDDYFGTYLGEISEIDYDDNKKPYLVEIIDNSMDVEILTNVFIWCSERVLERG